MGRKFMLLESCESIILQLFVYNKFKFFKCHVVLLILQIFQN